MCRRQGDPGVEVEQLCGVVAPVSAQLVDKTVQLHSFVGLVHEFPYGRGPGSGQAESVSRPVTSLSGWDESENLYVHLHTSFSASWPLKAASMASTSSWLSPGAARSDGLRPPAPG